MGLKNARQLTSNNSPSLTDFILICDPVLGPLKKLLLSILKTLFKSYWDVDISTACAAALATAQAYADGLVVGLWDDRGNFNASVNAYPSSGGSGTAGAIKKGDIWTISVAGTLPTGQVVEVGDVVRALVDTPGNTQANWAIQQNNIGYTAENTANKDTDGTLAANSDTKYASQKATKTAIATAKSEAITTSETYTDAAINALTVSPAIKVYSYYNFS